MNAPKCEASGYIDFLVAAPKVFGCTKAARVQSVDPQAPAHVALTRFLHQLGPRAEFGGGALGGGGPRATLLQTLSASGYW